MDVDEVLCSCIIGLLAAPRFEGDQHFRAFVNMVVTGANIGVSRRVTLELKSGELTLRNYRQLVAQGVVNAAYNGWKGGTSKTYCMLLNGKVLVRLFAANVL